ncbi:MAG TPA: hypothetical protein VM933_08045 [Acidimicrobiales bacterium]|nr:hypothetical protein [Acidimicrobiales bacterium]
MQDEWTGWVAGRLPDGWFPQPPDVMVDREELLIVGTLPDVELEPGAAPAALAAARSARTSRFREDTRAARIRIAAEAEHRFGRKVSWGVRIGDETVLFTTVSVPVMTRLRQNERRVLDTLVEAGVARSRSDALAWCVKLVGANQAEWITSLQEALVHVEKVRAEGPTA